MYRLSFIFCLCLLSAVALPAQDGRLEAQRASFKMFYEQAKAGELDSAAVRRAGLADYPLYPYLEGAQLSYQLRQSEPAEMRARVSAFLSQYPDTAITRQLRVLWLNRLAEAERWDSYLTYYDDELKSVNLRCHQVNARIQTQRLAGAAADAAKLWLVGKSQPKACDPVFEWMEEQGQLDQALIWRRLKLAMENGQAGLARYLSRQLLGLEQAKAKRWLALYKDPRAQIRELLKRKAPLVEGYMLRDGLKRLAFRDIELAGEALPKLAELYEMPAEDRYAVARHIALIYAQRQQRQALPWFRALEEIRLDERVHAWRVRAAVRQGNWQQARDWIYAMPEAQAQEDAWRYWLGRSQQALGLQDVARQVYAELAKERSYYGFLAADRLQQPYQLNPRRVEPEAKARQRLLALPGLLRARELFYLGLPVEAEREWTPMLEPLDKDQLRQAALLVHEWGWHSRAIVTLAKSDYWDDLYIRYPLPYRDEVQKRARQYGMAPSWIYGIIRTESLFMAEVVSSAGARGLMQLMPATGRQTARKAGRRLSGSAALSDPELNIHLGSAYLAEMMQRFGGQQVMAAAAYNAGPGRVREWQPPVHIPADVWVENIVFDETRGYVQRALFHSTLFQWRLGEKITPLSRRMPPVLASET